MLSSINFVVILIFLMDICSEAAPQRRGRGGGGGAGIGGQISGGAMTGIGIGGIRDSNGNDGSRRGGGGAGAFAGLGGSISGGAGVGAGGGQGMSFGGPMPFGKK